MNDQRRWIIGSFSIYARSPFTAWEVYNLVVDAGLTEPFGAVLMDTDEEVEWVNMAYGVKAAVPKNLVLPH
jgi:hypothetical protein